MNSFEGIFVSFMRKRIIKGSLDIISQCNGLSRVNLQAHNAKTMN